MYIKADEKKFERKKIFGPPSQRKQGPEMKKTAKNAQF